MQLRKHHLDEIARWYNVSDVAKLLTYKDEQGNERTRSRQHVHNLIRDDELRVVKTRNGYLIEPESVDAHIGKQASIGARMALEGIDAGS